jgi:hypothetical protein
MRPDLNILFIFEVVDDCSVNGGKETPVVGLEKLVAHNLFSDCRIPDDPVADEPGANQTPISMYLAMSTLVAAHGKSWLG